MQAVNTDHPLLRPEHIFCTLSVGALALLVVLALVAPCSTAHFISESYWPGPVTEYWMFLPTVASYWQGDWSLQDLLRPHGGHRIFFRGCFFCWTIFWSAPRYQSFVLLFWLCLAVLGSATPISRPAVRYGLRFFLMVASIAWVAFVLRPAESEQVKRISSFAREARLANAAIVVGVQDAPELQVVRGMAASWNVARSAVFLREEGLGPFADKRASLLGTRLGYLLKPVRDPGCHGKGMEVTRLPQSGALRVRGWASTGTKRALPWALVATNEAGDVVGLGESESELGMDGYYWILYSRPPQQAGGLVVWAVRDEYEVCLVTHLQVNSAVH